MTYEVAVVGTGDPDDPGREGYGMAYRHAEGYRRHDDCRLVACADLVPENAERFAAEYGLDAVYEDYERLCGAVAPDVVSVCVPPDAHAEVVQGLAATGAVRAIHCEKPMATTWRACREMAAACDRRDVALTFNHQLRLGPPYRRAKALLDEGRIGRLRRIEWRERNLFDAGCHFFDISAYLADGAAVEWVLAGLDYSEQNRWFGVHNENRALARWRYETGVDGLAATGEDEDLVGPRLRLLGTEGTVEVGADDAPLRVRADGGGWRAVDTGGHGVYGPRPGRLRAAVGRVAEALPGDVGDGVVGPTYTARAVAEVVDALSSGRESELAAANALAATEVVFAAWESARRRGRVDLPLAVEDNPLRTMVESGALDPAPARPSGE